MIKTYILKFKELFKVRKLSITNPKGYGKKYLLDKTSVDLLGFASIAVVREHFEVDKKT